MAGSGYNVFVNVYDGECFTVVQDCLAGLFAHRDPRTCCVPVTNTTSENTNTLVVRLNNVTHQLGVGGVFHGAVEIEVNTINCNSHLLTFHGSNMVNYWGSCHRAMNGAMGTVREAPVSTAAKRRKTRCEQTPCLGYIAACHLKAQAVVTSAHGLRHAV